MIRGYSNNNIGGLVGTNDGSITGSFSAVMVDGQDNIGGLVGANDGSVFNCYCNGTVTGDQSVGGLVGRNQKGSILNCYSTSRNSRYRAFGGLVGYNKGDITSSFWDTQTSKQATSAGGEGLTTAQMQDINTYLNAGWDFVDESFNGTFDYWQISPGGYPKLRFAADRLAIPEGFGTAEQPYLIRNVEDLRTVCFEPTAHYRLEASIDLSGTAMTVIPCFGGYFDGNGHTISHLYIRGGNYVGLFGQLESWAMIYNLGLEEMDVIGTGYYVGGLVGKITKGSIFNCYCTGLVTGEDFAGGLVGLNYGKISNCYRTGTAIGNEHVGGCVGTNFGEVTNCYSAVRAGSDGQFSIVVAYNDKIVTACFWDIDISELPIDSVRMSLTTAEMQTASTFIEAGWDFVGETANGTEDIWWIDEGQDYPKLWWQPRPQSAFSPNPQNGSKELIQPIILSWDAGDSAAGHDVYLDQDANAVALATTESADVYRGRLPAQETAYEPGSLEFATTYYWRIDEVNEIDPGKPCKGHIWSFTTAAPISHPDPADDGTSIVHSTVLSWVPGSTVLQYDVYFGENEKVVGDATPESVNVYAGRQASEKTSFEPDNLELNKTYYWRIDAVDPINPSNMWKGDVWKFTTVSGGRTHRG
jgi:hypothetical protein